MTKEEWLLLSVKPVDCILYRIGCSAGNLHDDIVAGILFHRRKHNGIGLTFLSDNGISLPVTELIFGYFRSFIYTSAVDPVIFTLMFALANIIIADRRGYTAV